MLAGREPHAGVSDGPDRPAAAAAVRGEVLARAGAVARVDDGRDGPARVQARFLPVAPGLHQGDGGGVAGLRLMEERQAVRI